MESYSRQKIVTIGGGVAGIEASSVLADLGYQVTVIEKENHTCGKLNDWAYLFPNGRKAEEVAGVLRNESHQKKFNLIKNDFVEEVIQSDAHFLLETNHRKQLTADAVLLSTGFDTFDATRKEEYGYSIYENVITSVDLEQQFRSGKPLLTSKGKVPKRIAFIHCVGSRDEKSGNHHCSRVCCVTGVKQAIKVSQQIPDAEIFNFYMDLRMFGLSYEAIYREAQEKYNIQFIRGRLSEASENQDERLQIKAEDTLSGRPLKMKVDLMVLLVGIIPGEDTKRMASLFNLECEPNGFLQVGDPHLKTSQSSQRGVFLAGACTGPMTVDETLAQARSAALDIHHYLQGK